MIIKIVGTTSDSVYSMSMLAGASRKTINRILWQSQVKDTYPAAMKGFYIRLLIDGTFQVKGQPPAAI